MKKEQLSEAMSFIDDDLLEQTNKLRTRPNVPSARNLRRMWVRYGSLAAALVAVAGVSVYALNGPLKAKSAKEASMTTVMRSAEYAAADSFDENLDAMLMETSAPEMISSSILTDLDSAAGGDDGVGDMYTKTGVSANDVVPEDISLACDYTVTEAAADHVDIYLYVPLSKEKVHSDVIWYLYREEDGKSDIIGSFEYKDASVFTNPDLLLTAEFVNGVQFSQRLEFGDLAPLEPGKYMISELFYTLCDQGCIQDYTPVEVNFEVPSK